VHACKSKSRRKVENDKVSSQTHNTQGMLSGKPFREKTQLEGEAASLSFSFRKYGYKYKEVISITCYETSSQKDRKDR